jgi:Beta propeller domain
MKPPFLTAAVVLIALCSHGCTAGSGTNLTTQEAQAAQAKPKKSMLAFRSEQELDRYLRELAEKQKRKRRHLMYELAAPATKAVAGVTDKKGSESVTNVQHAGVDEGGIVKVHGNHLVILRRGRLFTVSIADGNLEPVSAVDAFSPDIDPSYTWCDEMLISGDTVVVIGYSYERGGTEASLFHINPAGELTYQSTYQLRSNDYYSSRNYASRLIGSKLIFYTPLYLGWEADPLRSLPAVRKWHKGAKPHEFGRIVAATNVYRTEPSVTSDEDTALHTVTACDLANGGFDCKATSVVGPPGRVFYVSPNAVYVWATDWNSKRSHSQASMLYRMPLDGSAPSALRVSGSPVDQFSFLETEEGRLNVLVRSDAAGDGMWRAEVAAGDVALLRVNLATFSDGSDSVNASDYLTLPRAEGYDFQNRFVGDYLLYGSGSGWGYPKSAHRSPLFLVRWTDGSNYQLALDHGTDRIEQIGHNAVVVGTDGKDLHFTSVDLANSPEVAGAYVRKGASQGELRSQGFFYKPDGEDSGTLGLPISVPTRPGYRHLFETSAAILFLHNAAGHFSETGELGANPERAIDDKCRASCVDWYGNARPLFVRERIIALLGYELVEGSREGDHIAEIRRVSFAPSRSKLAAAAAK